MRLRIPCSRIRSSGAEISSSGSPFLSPDFFGASSGRARPAAASGVMPTSPAAPAVRNRLRLLVMMRPPGVRATVRVSLLVGGPKRLVVILDDLGDQLQELVPGVGQHGTAGGRGSVVPPPPPLNELSLAAQLTHPFQEVE